VKSILPVQTNIVVIELEFPEKRDEIITELLKDGIRIMAFGPGMLRMVTHLDVSSDDIKKVQKALCELTV
jgi:threonine aldolase